MMLSHADLDVLYSDFVSMILLFTLQDTFQLNKQCFFVSFERIYATVTLLADADLDGMA